MANIREYSPPPGCTEALLRWCHFVTLVKTLKTQGLTSNLLSSPDKKNHNCYVLLISLKPLSVMKEHLSTNIKNYN